MAKPAKIVQKGLQVLRRRVRYKGASLSLSDWLGNEDDTDKIRAAVRLYVQTWIEPIIDMIEEGDTRGLAHFVGFDNKGDEIGSKF